MKRLFWPFLLLCITSGSAYAQNWAYINSEVIIKHMPEYVSAEQQIKALADQWQSELDKKNKEIELLTKAFQADQVLMTDEKKKARQEEIGVKQKEAKDFQFEKFGQDGELAQKSDALMRPLQDRIAKAVQKIAEKDDLAMIYDKNELKILYANTRYDKTNEVIISLGLKP